MNNYSILETAVDMQPLNNQHTPANIAEQQKNNSAMTEVIQHQVLMQVQLGPQPQRITCPSCKVNATTQIIYEPSMKTHFLAALLCIGAGCYCCCCIPYLVNSCKRANHHCYACGTYVGSYNN